MSQQTIIFPTQLFVEALAPAPAGFDLAVWNLADEPEGFDPDTVALAVVSSDGGQEPMKRLATLPALRAVQTTSIGYDYVRDQVPPGVTLSNGASVHEPSTGELGVTLTLAALRRIPTFVRNMSDGRWGGSYYQDDEDSTAESLVGKRVLIVGYGGVGQAVADRLAGFGAELVPVARTARSGRHGAVHALAELPTLLPGADVVVLALPLSPETRHVVDREFLAALKPGALIVNVGRGGLVDTDALLEALTARTVRAALDVTEPEPLPADHPLWRAPGVLISPHVGGATDILWPKLVALLSDQIDRFAHGRPLRNLVALPTAPVAAR